MLMGAGRTALVGLRADHPFMTAKTPPRAMLRA